MLLGFLVGPIGSKQVWASQASQVSPPLTDAASIDQCYPTGNYAPGYALYYSSPCVSTQTVSSTRMMETWLKYDLSSIPPQATIVSAVLSLNLVSARLNTVVGVYFASGYSWSGNVITWNNAPLSSLGSASNWSNIVSNATKSYRWDVTQIVASIAPSQSRLTLVLKPTESQNSNVNGWVQFDGSSGALGASLSVTYSYASASVSLSANSVALGSSVSVSGNTDPYQSQGTMTLQYSADSVSWNTMSAQSGGSATFLWTPPSAGNFYVRSAWSTSWNNGAYTYSTSSGALLLFVTQRPSAVQLTASSKSIGLGDSVTLTASTTTPSFASDGTMTIQSSTDGNTWTQLAGGTPASGTFTYIWRPAALGTYYVRAIWSGDSNYFASTSAQQTIVVGRRTTAISLSAPPSWKLDRPVIISAKLTDSSGIPVQGGSVSFNLNSAFIGNAITDSSGFATLNYLVTVPAGSYQLVALYAGSSQYQSSSNQAGFTVNPWKFTVTSAVPGATLLTFNGRNYTSDSSGQVVINVNASATYKTSVISPIVFSPGERAIFQRWGDGTTSANRTFAVDDDITIAVATKVQYLLTLLSQYDSPVGTGWYDSGFTAQYTIHLTVDQGNSTRRVMTGWVKDNQPFSAAANGSLSIGAPTTLQATWQKQYLVQVISQYGNPQGATWYNTGSQSTVAVQSPFQVGSGTRYVLTGYVGTGAVPRAGNASRVPFTVSLPSNLTFSWKVQYYISIANGGGSTTTGGWYDSGQTVAVNATAYSNIIQNSSRLAFQRWTGSVNATTLSLSFPANQSYNLTAVWVQQYYVTASTAMGNIEGINWYNKSSSATIKVSPPAFGFLIQQVFNGWVENMPENGGVSTFVVIGPVDLHATWRTDYTQLIVLVAAVVGGGGAGGFYFVRKRKMRSPEHETIAKIEPLPTEPTGQTVVERQPQPEVGTSVYTGSACPSCGAVNSVGAVYCGSCGADLLPQ